MSKKIIILNPTHNIDALFDFFEELQKRSYKIKLLSRNKSLVKRFNENTWTAKNLFFWPQISSLSSLLLAFFLLPIIAPALLVVLSILKFKRNINTILCFSHFDKIFTASIAKLLKMEIIWLIYPDLQYIKINKIIKFFIKRTSRHAILITLSNFCKMKLVAEKYSSKNIHSITPSIKIIEPHQENMFEKMAENDKKNQLKKFFTLGTIIDLNEENNLETILNSIKKILTVIPNLQFIIIGDGETRKKLKWLTKKMAIENLVWFVGKQKQLKKWFENFDIYIISSTKKSLFDINNTLKAMNASLPILAEETDIWSEIVKNNQTGVLLESFNSETISQEVIKLKQNPLIRNRLGSQAESQINSNHTIKQMVDKFIEIV